MNLNIRKRIERIFAITRPPIAQNTETWKIILAENETFKIVNEQLVNDNIYLSLKIGRLNDTFDNITGALNECYSTIAALENRNKQLKNYEDYSYYAGSEITCNRTPLKYCAWLNSKKKDDGGPICKDNNCVYLEADKEIINEHIEKEQALEQENAKLQEQIQIVIRNIDAGAVSINWIKDFLCRKQSKVKCSCCGGTGKPCSCGEYHPKICMCPPHEVRMKWGKNVCPDCGMEEKK